jgi:hypothetical protein
MKFQRTTLGLLLSALLLGGGVYFYEIQGSAQRQTTQAEAKRLFTFQEAQVKAFTLTLRQRTLSFQRLAAKTTANAPKPSSNWTVAIQDAAKTRSAPQPANEASVAYLLNLMSTGDRQSLKPDAPETTLTVPASRAAEFGFDQTPIRIEVTLENGKPHRLVLGKANFSNSALYAQVDPSASSSPDLKVVLVSSDFKNAVNRPVSEWQNTPLSDKSSDR